MSEYLSKEEIKKWRSSVEKITLEEYAARLGKKLQEEKKTNDLADMLYSHYNPMQSMNSYDTITKLEKIDLTPKSSTTKHKAHSSKNEEDVYDIDNDNLMLDDQGEDNFDDNVTLDVEQEMKTAKKVAKLEQKTKEKVKADKTEKKADAPKEKVAKSPKAVKEEVKPAKAANKTSGKSAPKTEAQSNFADLNITFKKNLTDREEKVLSYFVEKRGEIVYAKDLAELLDLKRDYIYKYIKNLRAKMSTDLIANADNGGFKLN